MQTTGLHQKALDLPHKLASTFIGLYSTPTHTKHKISLSLSSNSFKVLLHSVIMSPTLTSNLTFSNMLRKSVSLEPYSFDLIGQ